MATAVAPVGGETTQAFAVKVQERFASYCNSLRFQLSFAIVSPGVGVLGTGPQKVVLSLNASELDGKVKSKLSVLCDPSFTWSKPVCTDGVFRMRCLAVIRERKPYWPDLFCPKVAEVQYVYEVPVSAIDTFRSRSTITPSNVPLRILLKPPVDERNRILKTLQNDDVVAGGARLLAAQDINWA